MSEDPMPATDDHWGGNDWIDFLEVYDYATSEMIAWLRRQRDRKQVTGGSDGE